MKHTGIAALLGMGMAQVFASSCSSSVHQGDSETHWIVCKTTDDCHGGQTCEDERCVTPVALRIANPTGDCVAKDSGSRAGYHSLEPGDVWLPDCKNTLKREYYRVFAKSDASAYIIPRPDGATELDTPCNEPAHPLRALVDRYSLCTSATDTATVERMNAMPPAEALELTHYLHTQLLFEPTVVRPGPAILPYPFPSDVIDVCTLHARGLSTEFAADCAAQRQAMSDGTPEGPTFEVSAPELAMYLRELYGIGATCGGIEFPVLACTACGPAGGCGTTEIRCTRPCTSAADCQGAGAGEACVRSVCGPTLACL